MSSNGVNSMFGFLSRSHQRSGSFTHNFATNEVQLPESETAVDAGPDTSFGVALFSHQIIETAKVKQSDEVHVVLEKLTVSIVRVFLNTAHCM